MTAYAYFECEQTPSFRLRPEVFPILTADRSEWRDAAFAAEDAALMERWAGSGCATWGVYDYYYGRDMAMPRVFYRAQSASVKQAAKHGASLFFAEMNPDWGLDAPKAWLAARLAWAPGADTEALLGEYFERAYGPAAPAMRRFHNLVERRWADRPEPPRWIRFYHEESVAVLFPSDVRRELTRALTEARAAVDASPAGAVDARLLRRRCRVLGVALAWTRCDAFAAWYDARAELACLPRAEDTAGLTMINDAYLRCERLRVGYLDACAKWNASPLNPGSPFEPDAMFGGDVAGLAAMKCDGLVTAPPVLPASAVAATSSVASPQSVELLYESFEPAAFGLGSVTGAPACRRVVPPASPWVGGAAEAEFVRMGPDATRSLSGKTSLLMAGTSHAMSVRRLAVSPGDTLGATVAYSGKVVAGEHVALYIRFVDSAGRKLARVTRCVAFPGGDDAWRTLAVTGVAPADAAAVDVTLRVMNQDPGDAVWFDDLAVRRVPAGTAK